jgi:hypothetical protein
MRRRGRPTWSRAYSSAAPSKQLDGLCSASRENVLLLLALAPLPGHASATSRRQSSFPTAFVAIGERNDPRTRPLSGALGSRTSDGVAFARMRALEASGRASNMSCASSGKSLITCGRGGPESPAGGGVDLEDCGDAGEAVCRSFWQVSRSAAQIEPQPFKVSNRVTSG